MAQPIQTSSILSSYLSEALQVAIAFCFGAVLYPIIALMLSLSLNLGGWLTLILVILSIILSIWSIRSSFLSVKSAIGLRRGDTLLNLGEYEDAVASYNKALEIYQGNFSISTYAQAWNNHGVALYKHDRYADALASYEKALKMDPKNNIVCYNRDDVLRKLGQYDDSVTSYDKAIAINPKDALAIQPDDPSYNKFHAELQDKRNEEERIQREIALKEEQEKKRKEAESLIAKARDLASRGQYIQAITKVDEALEILPNTKEYQDIRIKLVKKDPKPNLAISLQSTSLRSDSWQKLSLIFTNSGKGDALKVSITLSDEFETRRIETHNVSAGALETIEIPVRPKHDGHVPFDIIINYEDSQKRSYETAAEFWIDVIDRVSGTSTPSPVAGFAPQPQSPTTFPPELANKYTDVTLIGKGGFGRVFRAKRIDDTKVAVKIPLSIDAATGKSFIAELQSWTRLSHPNIVKLYDYNIMPIPYFEMEYCSDGSLAEMEKPVEPREAAWIIFNVCEGLKVAHNQRLIHLDLKPHNVLMKNGVPKVSDWGLAKVMSESTTTTTTSFTTYYAAPEQFSSSKKDERTDIWQIGIIFYELVTGVLPFKGGSMVEVMSSITTKTPTPPSDIVADAAPVEGIILKCLEKEPKNRYQSVLELQRELARYLEMNYTEELKKSVTAGNNKQIVYYCGELVLTALHTGDLKSAYKYLQDLLVYAKGDVKDDVQSLADTMQFMVENEMEVSDDILMKADLLVHRMRVG